MFSIRRIYDDTPVANKDAINQVLVIMRKQFPNARPEDFEKIPMQLHDPMHYKYRSILFVAQDSRDRVRGLAMLLHMPDLGITYLEMISAAPGKTGGGILYDGNGTQDIFYEHDDILTVSTHGDPHFAYPHFSGFADEAGAGRGVGYNINYPLPENASVERYQRTLAGALKRIKAYKPDYFVLSLGLDTAKADPTGTWTLQASDFHKNGVMIGAMNLPTLLVQEGGYRTRTLGVNARRFFEGLDEGYRNTRKPVKTGKKNIASLMSWAQALTEHHERVRAGAGRLPPKFREKSDGE